MQNIPMLCNLSSSFCFQAICRKQKFGLHTPYLSFISMVEGNGKLHSIRAQLGISLLCSITGMGTKHRCSSLCSSNANPKQVELFR